jgi:hypothetical protein
MHVTHALCIDHTFTTCTIIGRTFTTCITPTYVTGGRVCITWVTY